MYTVKHSSRNVSNEVIKLYGIDYGFEIRQYFDILGEPGGFILTMYPNDDQFRADLHGDTFFHEDLEVVKQVMQAAIDEEVEERYFMVTNGNNLFSRMYRRVKDQKLGKNKNKVFSLRLDADLQKNFSKMCRERGHSKSVVVRILMEKYIETNSFSLR